MTSTRHLLRCLLLLTLLIAGRTAVASDPPAAAVFECQMVYEHAAGFYVDVGAERGILKGHTGWLEVQGERIAQVQVVASAEESSFLRLLTTRPLRFPQPRDAVTLVLEDVRPPQDPAPMDLSHTLLDGEDQLFVPLLAESKDFGVEDPQSVVSGRLTTRQLYQYTSGADLDYLRSQVITAGTVERIDGTPWSLEWNMDWSLRLGDGFEDVDDFEEVRWQVYRFAVSRRFDDASTVRFGRFIPRELPSVGYLDGIQGEKVVSANWRYGALAGFKPYRDDLDPTGKEPTFSAYVTYDSLDAGEWRYASTSGVLTSLYERDLDRVALLWDQTLRSDRWDIFSSSEVDLDVGANETNDGMRLTRWDLSASYRRDGWTPRAGLVRFELLDSEARRDLLDLVVLNEADFFGDDFWRYWVGARHELPGNFVLDEEISYTDSRSIDGVRYRLSLTKREFLDRPGATSTVSIYNLLGDEQQGLGGQISAFLPTEGGRLFLQPAVTLRWVDFDTGGQDFEFLDVSMRAHWRLSPAWNFQGGASYSYTDDINRVLLDVGLTWRF